jgi:signal transduction histidine kinase/HAMP domain-containing protein
MNQKHPLRKLRSQLVITFLAGSLGIIGAIGIPVILLINRQAVSQAQLLLDQAILTTQASLLGEQSDLQNLALLISQRPTLTQLLEQGDIASLESYLDTLRDSVNLDLLIVCKADEDISGAADAALMVELCSSNLQSGFVPAPVEKWSLLYAAADLKNIPASPYKIVVGKSSSAVLTQLQEETGLVYLLVWQNQIIAATEPLGEIDQATLIALKRQANQSPVGSLEEWTLDLDNHQYIFAIQNILPDADLNLISALNVDEQIAIQNSLSRTLILGLLFIVLIAFGLGLWLSQRISHPIAQLADAASKFRQRDFNSSVSVQSSVWEISQLANTLEDARTALQHSLTQLEAEKAWIEHLLNSIIEGILTLDFQNRITFASAGLEKITGGEFNQIIGRKIDDIFFPLEGDEDFSDQLPAAGQQRRISVRLRNGQERLLSISKAKLVPPEASTSNRALVIRDVTNEEYIHRLLGDFMANITHEFRTPLAALEASSELLLDNLTNLSQTEIKELLAALNLGIINLQTLIDNLIEAASIEAGRFKVSPQPLAISSILKDAHDIIRPLAEKYALRLVASFENEPILVMADHRRTVQALVNLLSNAIKHSPERGYIQLKYSVIEKKVRIEVTDEGSGVPLDQRNNLFRRFVHLDSSNERARQGAGLGLSVVKAIVEAQQGEVGITDLPEGGTSFWFTVPLANGSNEK